MTGSRPLRFLLVWCAGWTTLRIIVLEPGWWTPPAAATGSDPPPPIGRTEPSAPLARPRRALPRAALALPFRRAEGTARASFGAFPIPFAGTTAEQPAEPGVAPQWLPSEEPRSLLPMPGRAAAGRLSAYAWAFLRDGGGSGLAPGGTLGGAQTGLRALYRLNRDPGRPFALSARLSSPIHSAAGAEAALGLDWQPSRRLPLHLLAERRQKLGPEGRSAFGLTVHGGISDAPVGPLRIDAYAQAGIVGIRSRDPFADGALRLSLPFGRAKLGAGAWAAAQPGVERVDIGPQASFRLPVAGRSVTLAADWRLRVAGTARPGSGPTLTLGSDF